MPAALPRVHLVTPAIVERTVARHGVRGILSDREREAFDAFPTETRRVDWLSGRIAAKRAVRRALRDQGDTPPVHRAIDVWNDTNGAPRLTIEDRPSVGGRLSVSISHTRGAALAAVVDRIETGTVGVDVEPTVALRLTLVRRVMSQAERLRYDAESEYPSPLVVWMAKEAAMKAANHVCSALRDIELSWEGHRCVSARVVGKAAPDYEIIVRHRTVGAFTVALALCR